MKRIAARTRAHAQALRESSTAAEAKLWWHLRNRRLQGLRFRRQHPFGRYILDFYCPEQKLVIEVDGSQHFEGVGVSYDAERTKYLEARGLTVMRFNNAEVLAETEAVLEAILEAVRPSP